MKNVSDSAIAKAWHSTKTIEGVARKLDISKEDARYRLELLNLWTRGDLYWKNKWKKSWRDRNV